MRSVVARSFRNSCFGSFLFPFSLFLSTSLQLTGALRLYGQRTVRQQSVHVHEVVPRAVAVGPRRAERQRDRHGLLQGGVARGRRRRDGDADRRLGAGREKRDGAGVPGAGGRHCKEEESERKKAERRALLRERGAIECETMTSKKKSLLRFLSKAGELALSSSLSPPPLHIQKKYDLLLGLSRRLRPRLPPRRVRAARRGRGLRLGAADGARRPVGCDRSLRLEPGAGRQGLRRGRGAWRRERL